MVKELDEPNMSDRTLLVSVEDLINIAMGPAEKNMVNFKLVQTILHILARQMRLLEQRVEIRFDDESSTSPTRDKEEKKRHDKSRGRKKGKSDETKGGKGSKESEGSPDKQNAERERDKDKDERTATKDRDKKVGREKAASKKQESLEEDSEEERVKEDKDKSRAEKKPDKDHAKERVKAGRGKSKERGITASDSSIIISEKDRKKEKVLVVEKGPTTRSDARRESIEVVTRSQFDLVEALVRDLQSRAGPMPALELPDNEKLRSDLARGNASLPDAMQAMQVTARVRAAEEAISRMGDLLTQLAAAGALPKNFADKIDEVKFEPPEADAITTASGGPKKSRAIEPSGKSVAIQGESATNLGENAMTGASRAAVTRTRSIASRASVASSVAGLPGVTHPEMGQALRTLREDLMNNIQAMTAKASTVTENVNVTMKSMSDKLALAMVLSDRISTLNALVSDYAEQLSGFDSGLTTQIQSFNDQMGQMRNDLNAGLGQLQQMNNNTENVAVMELTERYESLSTEIEQTLNSHNTLTTFQRQLSDQLHSLVECVEMLREQKADCDEVQDGLRDKADNSRLAGLLTSAEFAVARSELENRLEVCHEKFQRQENTWMIALKDLSNIIETKAEVMQLLSTRVFAEQALQELQAKQEKLALILGEPKAAMLRRALAVGAACGACQAPASMEPQDESFGAPPPLPALRPRPIGASAPSPQEPCITAWQPPYPPDNREHTCHRWCGGSHTLLAPVTHEQAPQFQMVLPPTKKFAGFGSDGRLYMMEKALEPCLECNQLSEKVLEETPGEQGAGDQGEKATAE